VRIRFTNIILVLVVAQLAACVPPTPTGPWHGNPYPERVAAPDFRLTDTHGRLFQLSSQKGSPVLLYFGYTHSPDTDPATLYNVAWVLDKLSERPDYHVVFAMITIDPGRDTPEILRHWLDAYNPGLVGLSGDQNTLQAVEKAYGVTAQIQQSSGPGSQEYTVDHPSILYAIDRQGRLVTRYPYGTEPEDILSDMFYLLQE
jgi:protein SCO1/2